uniref:Uncharacterized protein n=1 Tax=Rhizophora mucronata TaxID=61149 RepID=A0A2P2J8Z6_RHIMU
MSFVLIVCLVYSFIHEIYVFFSENQRQLVPPFFF